MTDTPQQIPVEIKHWSGRVLHRQEGGTVRDALVAAVKAGAYLRDADLTGADLTGADGQKVKITGFASLQFSGHGECGRPLLALRTEDGATHLHCGCFRGSVDDLRAYIANGAAHLRKTRTLALDTALVLLDAKNDEPAS